MIFETHAHYDDQAFDHDRDQLLKSFSQNGIQTVVNVSSSLSSVKETIKLTEKYSFVYGAIGIHPCDTKELDRESFAWLKEQCSHKKTVAIGEIGLDYHWKEPEISIQKKWFEKQLILAQELHLPVIIHSREAAKDTLDIMKSLHAEKSGGVIHCFSYSRETAAEFLKLDFYFGIGGVITFPNAKKLKEAVSFIPIEKIVLETDSPYLAPQSERGKRNTSLNIPFIAEEIGKIKGMSREEIIEITDKNAKNLYRLS